MRVLFEAQLATVALVLTGVLALNAVGLGCRPGGDNPGEGGSVAVGSKEYVFTTDWFGSNIPRWERLLADYKGKPDIRYLEIGTYEGRSLFWMLDNILTHPDSELVAIDIFFDEYEGRFLKNLEASGEASRITVIKDRGEYAMKTLDDESFDIMYIDGGHAAPTVYAQAALGWQLLKVGGIMILDDYKWNLTWPLDLRPELPIDAFLTAFSQEIEILDRGRDVVVRKTRRACGEEYYCSPVLEGVLYLWDVSGRNRLVFADGGTEIPLSQPERRLLEETLATLAAGETRYGKLRDPARAAAYERLLERLQAKLAERD